MQQKADVDYGNGMEGRYCKTCRFFRAPTSRCIKVYGIIDPNKWCKLWKKKQ